MNQFGKNIYILFMVTSFALLSLLTFEIIFWISTEWISVAKPVMKETKYRLRDDVTIVTAYFDIGDFRKGPPTTQRHRSDYENWMKAFRFIQNPVVAFFDWQHSMATKFSDVRKNLSSLTKIVKIKRKELWTFNIRDNVTKIFSQRGYRRHYPNTVIPDYACVSSSRFELVKVAIEENPFATQYFAWVDFGYFRKPLTRNMFLSLPPHFEKNKIAFSEVAQRNETITAEEIVRRNVNWLAAGYFTGNYKVLYQFVSGYLHNLRYFLDRRLMGAEQQMIYSMVNTKETREFLPEIQTYSPYNTNNTGRCRQVWTFIGCICGDQLFSPATHVAQ